jgi:hypothetical protein
MSAGQKLIAPRHLGSPILMDQLIFFKENPTCIAKKYPNLCPEHFQDISSGKFLGKAVFPMIERHVCTRAYISSSSAVNIVKEAAEAAYLSCSEQLKALMKDIRGTTERDLVDFKDAVRESSTLRVEISNAAKVEAIHAGLRESNLDYKEKVVLGVLPGVSFHGDLVLLEDTFQQPLVVTMNMFVGVLDKIESKYRFQLVLALFQKVSSYNKINFHTWQDKLYKMLDLMYEDLAVKSHKILKSLEAIMVGFILHYYDNEHGDDEFLKAILQDLKDEGEDVSKWVGKIVNFIQEWKRSEPDEITIGLIESYGQEKLHFYPIIDHEAGLEKMKSEGKAFKDIDDGVAKRIFGQFVLELIEKHYKKTGKLMEIDEYQDLDPRIRSMYERRVILPRGELLRIEREKWADITFVKNVEFDYRLDDMDHLIDKACSPDEENISQIFDPLLRNKYNIRDPKMYNHRRFTNWLLDQKSIDVKKIFDRWDALGHLPVRTSVIILMMKELEQKVGGRPFSVTHPEVRVVASSLEHNISKSVLPLFGTQSMTMSGSGLEQRKEQLVWDFGNKNCRKVAINLDFSNWNYTFRHGLTYRFDRLFCELFGVTHFYWANRIFYESKILYGARFSPPGNLEGLSEWVNHLGGNQGFRQKFWTLITQSMLLLILEDENVRYALLGSGDNQVIVLDLDENQWNTNIVTRIKLAINKMSEDVGLKLKVAETFHSSKLFGYGRKYYWKGEPMSLVIKATTKFAAGISSGIVSLSSHVATSMSAGQQVASNCPNPMVGPFLAYCEMIFGMRLNPDWNSCGRWSAAEWAVIMATGGGLGVLPTVQLKGFTMSSFQDPLSENLALLKSMWEVSGKLRHAMSRLLPLSLKPADDESKMSMVLDPGNVSHSKPVTIESKLKAVVQGHFRDKVRVNNKIIKSMLESMDQDKTRQTCMELLKIKPVNLTVAHALFDSSAVGQVVSCVNRFSNFDTLVRMAGKESQKEGGQGLEAMIGAVDKASLKHLNDKKAHLARTKATFEEVMLGNHYAEYRSWCGRTGWVDDCSYSLRNYLAAQALGLRDDFVRGSFCPSPIEQGSFIQDSTGVDREFSIVILPVFKLAEHVEDMEISRGPLPRYVGSKTKDVMTPMKLVNLTGYDNGNSINVLHQIGTWLVSNGNDTHIQDFIKDSLDARIKDLSTIYEKMQTRNSGGTLEHRITVPGRETGVYNSGSSLISTYYKLSTNDARGFQRSSDDYNVFFQNIFTHVFFILRFTEPVRIVILYDMKGSCCLRKLEPTDYSVSAPLHIIQPKHERPKTYLPDDMSRVSQLVEEANLTPDGVADHVPNECSGLCSALAHQVVQQVINMNRNKFELNCARKAPEFSSAAYNITLLRKVPLRKLLQSIVFCMAAKGQFSNDWNMYPVSEQVCRWASSDKPMIDVTVFKSIVDALGVAGRFPELVKVAKRQSIYDIGQDLSAMIPVFLTALANEALLLEAGRLHCSYFIRLNSEHRITSYERKALLRYSKTARVLLRHYREISLSKLLSNRNGMYDGLQFTASISVNRLIEKSRNLEERLLINAEEPEPDRAPETNTFTPLPGRFDCDVCLDSRDSLPSMKDKTSQSSLDYSTKVNDQLLIGCENVAKWDSSVSSARVKFLEVVGRCKLANREFSSGIFLAEGGGSIISEALHLFPSMMALFNDLIVPEELPDYQLPTYQPPGTVCPCGIDKRVINTPYSSATFGDLLIPGTWNELEEEVSKLPKGQRLMTFDMQDSEEGREVRKSILSQVFDHFISWNVTTGILKTFPMDFDDDICDLCDKLVAAGYNWKLFKLRTSSPFNSELYFVVDRSSTSLEQTSVSAAKHLIPRVLTQYIQSGEECMLSGLFDLAGWVEQNKMCSGSNPVNRNQFDISHRKFELISATLLHHYQYLFTLLATDHVKIHKGEGTLLFSNTKGSDTHYNQLSVMAYAHQVMAALFLDMADGPLEPVRVINVRRAFPVMREAIIDLSKKEHSQSLIPLMWKMIGCSASLAVGLKKQSWAVTAWTLWSHYTIMKDLPVFQRLVTPIKKGELRWLTSVKISPLERILTPVTTPMSAHLLRVELAKMSITGALSPSRLSCGQPFTSDLVMLLHPTLREHRRGGWEMIISTVGKDGYVRPAQSTNSMHVVVHFEDLIPYLHNTGGLTTSQVPSLCDVVNISTVWICN